MTDFRKVAMCIAAYIALSVVNGNGQSTLTVNVDGATTLIPKEIFGVLMERLGRRGSVHRVLQTDRVRTP